MLIYKKRNCPCGSEYHIHYSARLSSKSFELWAHTYYLSPQEPSCNCCGQILHTMHKSLHAVIPGTQIARCTWSKYRPHPQIGRCSIFYPRGNPRNVIQSNRIQALKLKKLESVMTFWTRTVIFRPSLLNFEMHKASSVVSRREVLNKQ